MIKTELRFIVRNSIPTSSENGNNVNGNGVPGEGINNPSFRYYTSGWSGNTMGTSAPIYNSLTNDGTTGNTISTISGWDWNNGYMVSRTGETSPLWQPVENITTGETYKIQFSIKDTYSGNTITPYLYGYSGTTITTPGQYTQYIYIGNSPTGNTISFISNGLGYAGITNISVNSTGNQYRRIDLYDDETFTLTFQIQTNINNKGATYSKTIKVPGTANNNIIFNQLMEESVFINPSEIKSGDTSGYSVIFLNKKIDAGIYNDSIELLTGYFELQKVIKTYNSVFEYEGVFYSTIKTIADAIGDKEITGNENSIDDIDISEYDSTFNWQNIQSSWGGTNYSDAKGLYYPMIDYANIRSGSEYRMEQFKPCCYVKEVWDKIFEGVGFSYTSSFLNSDTFKSLVIPMGNTRRESDFNIENSRFKVGLTNSHDINLFLSGTTTRYSIDRIRFDKESGGDFEDPSNQYSTVSYSWTVTNTGTYAVNALIRYGLKFDTDNGHSWQLYNGSSQKHTIKLFIMRKRGNVTMSIASAENIHNGDWNCHADNEWLIPPDGEDSGIIHCTTGDDYTDTVDLIQGDELYVEAWLSTDGGFAECGFTPVPITGKLVLRVQEYQASVSDPSSFSNVPTDGLNYYVWGENVYANDTLPKMKQIKFLQSVCNKFNLMFCEDRTNLNNLIIEPYDDFYYSGQTYNDWSLKIDLSKEKWIERIPYLIDKDLSFSLKKDTKDLEMKDYIDATNNAFGDRLIKNPYYSNEIQKIEDEFSSTMLEYYGGTNVIVSTIIGERTNYEQDEVTGTLPQSVDYEPRFLYRNFIYNAGLNPITIRAWYPGTYQGDNPGDTPLLQDISVMNHYYPYAGFLDDPYKPTLDLNYGVAKYYKTDFVTTNNLGWVYWKNKVSQYMNPNSKMVTLYLKLNTSDIALLDFRKKIMLNNNLYRINRILEWAPGNGDSCKVELFQDAALNTDAYLTSSVWETYKNSRVFNGSVGPRPARKLILSGQRPNEYPQSYVYISGLTYSYATGTTFPDFNTYFSGTSTKSWDNSISTDANTLVIGNGNVVKGKDTLINGNYNYIDGNKSIILGGDNNIIKERNNIIINSNDNTINTGFTGNILINTTGQTITQSNKTYINDRDVDTFATYTYINNAVSGLTTGFTITNNTDNYVLTATGTGNTINGESKLTFGATLSLGASFSPPIETITATNTKLGDTHHTVIVSGVTTITLQKASDFPNRVYIIKKIGAGNMTLNVDNIGDRIYLTSTENNTSYTISTDGVAVTVQSDGTSRWYVLTYTDRGTSP